MSMQATIEHKIRARLDPVFLEVENESHRHSVPSGSESHFKVTVVSPVFVDKQLIARHRLLNETLAEELAGSIHALSLHTYTPEEWHARGGEARVSPPCLGGSKSSYQSS